MADISRGRAVHLDRNRPPALRVPSALAPRAGLALVLGVLLRSAVAAAIEGLRAEIPDARRMAARILDAPVLATPQRIDVWGAGGAWTPDRPDVWSVIRGAA